MNLVEIEFTVLKRKKKSGGKTFCLVACCKMLEFTVSEPFMNFYVEDKTLRLYYNYVLIIYKPNLKCNVFLGRFHLNLSTIYWDFIMPTTAWLV